MSGISRFPVPALEDLPDDIRERILAVQERTGFVPNKHQSPTYSNGAGLLRLVGVKVASSRGWLRSSAKAAPLDKTCQCFATWSWNS